MHRNAARPVRLLLALGLALLLLAAGHSRAAAILFIGNSFTWYNNGLDKELEALAPGTVTARVVAGGYTLEQHWNEGKALQKLRERKWDYVVLQEQSQTPVFDARKYHDYARRFDEEIRRSGARTILLMTWERPDSVKQGVTTANLAASVNALGSRLGVKIAPAGLAFARSLQRRPGLPLTVEDGHPTVAGSYLAACVLYGTLFGRSAEGIVYADRGIAADIRDHLQRVAAEYLR
jgi:hypothetical protein